MIVTAFRTGPALVSTGLLPDCTVLGSEECAICGLPYILVLTDQSATTGRNPGELPVHLALLREAIAQSHKDGHARTSVVSDGVTFRFR